MRTENQIKLRENAYNYVLDKQNSILPVLVDIIDNEGIKRKAMDELQSSLDLLYELKKDYGTEDEYNDTAILHKTSCVLRTVIQIMDNNK